MTFDDDCIRVAGQTYRCKDLGIEWPPPKLLRANNGQLLEQISCSELTDEERASMTHVCRGAEYKVFKDTNSHSGRH